MTDAPATIGHNNPPAPTPLEAMAAHIEDLFETAKGFLDGEPIANQETADLVGKLIDEARKAEKAGTDARKKETKPLDDAKKVIMDAWRPLVDEKTGKCALVVSTAKKALVPWLEKLEAEQRAAADAARAEADRLAKEAADAAVKVRADDLEANERLEEQRKTAAVAERVANRADKARPTVAGGARAIGLRTNYIAELTDAKAALVHYMQRQPDLLKAWLTDQAQRDTNAGARSIPGFTINPERKAA